MGDLKNDRELMSIIIALLLNSFSYANDLKFCVATAAHQIEGGNVNSDWWDWEKAPGKIKNTEHSGLACDHWNRVDEDISLMKWLGIHQYRFSIEWAKIEPKQNQYDPVALAHYSEEISKLKYAGIQPMITLHHFTLPKWFQDRGGWMAEDAPLLFEKYVAYVFSAIGATTHDWITFNEPLVHIAGGYLVGLTPPERKDLIAIKAKPLVQILKAHALAYHRMHEISKAKGFEIRVGVANHLRVTEPLRAWNPLDRFAANILDDLTNWNFIDAIETGEARFSIPFTMKVREKIDGLKGSQDFIGVNYYTRDLVKFTGKKPMMMSVSVKKDSMKNDLGWEIYAKGFEEILLNVSHRYPAKPILITENGIADSTDSMRSDFLKSHISSVYSAIAKGAKIESYCHWSLLDNFEWIEGFSPRFGLFEVDYKTFARKPRKSAYLYKEIISSKF